MLHLLSVTLTAVFLILALFHVYWAFRASKGKTSAVPEVDGKPVFVPSRSATLGVATILFGCALLVTANGGLVNLPVPRSILFWLMIALALAFFARAVGDFRLVGFFKKVKGTRFAWLDYRIFSPLCLAIAVVATYLAYLGRP